MTKPLHRRRAVTAHRRPVRRHRGDIEHARKNSTDVSELVRREPCPHQGLEVFFDRYEVHLHGEAVPLTAKEFEILALLAESPGEVFTRRRIYEHLWGEVAEVDENSITVFMRKIRGRSRIIPSEPRYLLTVWRVGYKLAAE
ncbi:MAG: winged helix-turn-helix domain-containing protein [Collinsella sp.]